MNQVWMDVDNADSKIALFTLAVDESTTSLNKKVQATMDPDIKLAKQGCRPLFLVVRHGQCVGTVDGVDAPQLNIHLQNNLPKAQK